MRPRTARLATAGLAAALLLLTTAACGGDEQDDAKDAGTGSDTVSCSYPTDGTEPARPVDPPSSEASKTPVTATIETTAGSLTATLSADTTPCTVNSFVSLAKQGFYDKTPCPRLTTYDGFKVLQCGDPTGTRSGGPGYTFDDELTGDETYTAGVLAMANSGPDTNGSQFFIVYGDTQLDPNYTVFGTVTAGLEGLDELAKAGTTPDGDGTPNTPTQITKVTIG